MYILEASMLLLKEVKRKNIQVVGKGVNKKILYGG